MVVERELVDFFGKIWGENKGVVRLATKDAEGRFPTSLFMYPENIQGILDKVNTANSQGKDVFYSPDLFTEDALRERKFTKNYVRGSRVICLDFDGNAPQDDTWYSEHNLPLPSIKVQTSGVDNQHVYWALDEFVVDVEALENIRRTITYSLSADSSGWDAGQLLRVPYTVNHKFGKPEFNTTYDVFIEEDYATDRVYQRDIFPVTKDFRPLLRESIDFTDLPSLVEVLANNEFVSGFSESFQKVPDQHKRSDALMRVAYDGAESGLSEKEIYVLIEDADRRWEKYTHRKDKHTRYVDLIERAKRKHPHAPVEISFTDDVEVSFQRVYSWGDALASDISIAWAFEGLMSTTGYGMLAGPPNVGKTQLAIRLGACCVLRQEYITWPCVLSDPLNVLFYSLEMNLVSIKYFIEQMTDLAPHLETLTKHFFIAPINDLIDFNDKAQREQIEADIEKYEPGLIIIDSLSMAASESLNDDKTARQLNATFKSIRRHANCAVVSVHHSRKGTPTGALDEIYGSRFIASDADFVITFVPEYDDQGEAIAITAVHTKLRLGKWKPSVHLTRTSDLNFVPHEESPIAFVQRASSPRDGILDTGKDWFGEQFPGGN